MGFGIQYPIIIFETILKVINAFSAYSQIFNITIAKFDGKDVEKFLIHIMVHSVIISSLYKYVGTSHTSFWSVASSKK